MVSVGVGDRGRGSQEVPGSFEKEQLVTECVLRIVAVMWGEGYLGGGRMWSASGFTCFFSL